MAAHRVRRGSRSLYSAESREHMGGAGARSRGSALNTVPRELSPRLPHPTLPRCLLSLQREVQPGAVLGGAGRLPDTLSYRQVGREEPWTTPKITEAWALLYLYHVSWGRGWHGQRGHQARRGRHQVRASWSKGKQGQVGTGLQKLLEGAELRACDRCVPRWPELSTCVCGSLAGPVVPQPQIGGLWSWELVPWLHCS